MSLDLYVDGPRWRAHLRGTADDHPGIIPVVKGNGYGFGLAGLARRTQWLGCDTLAVGTYREVADVISRFDGDVVVMEPWRPFIEGVHYGSRVIHTVGRSADLAGLAAMGGAPRVILEGLTSMGRHGFAAAELAEVRRAARGIKVEGHALHLPLGDSHDGEVERWLSVAPSSHWYVSHVGRDELARLRSAYPDIELRPRIGTDLWLGDRSCLTVRSTVLDAHPIRRGERVGYWQRRAGRDGVVLVVSGGTAHGIGLEAPAPAASPRQRAVSLAKGGLDAVGRSLSPYVVDGRARWFVEPPHMQVSLIFVPATVEAPAIGETLATRVRFTTVRFDAVHIS